MNNIKFISIDLQNDFSSEKGSAYKPRPSVDFVKKTLVPFFRKHNIKIAEIVSDYRQPRPGDTGDCCRPGAWGFESEIPGDVKIKKLNNLGIETEPVRTDNRTGKKMTFF